MKFLWSFQETSFETIKSHVCERRVRRNTPHNINVGVSQLWFSVVLSMQGFAFSWSAWRALDHSLAFSFSAALSSMPKNLQASQPWYLKASPVSGHSPVRCNIHGALALVAHVVDDIDASRLCCQNVFQDCVPKGTGLGVAVVPSILVAQVERDLSWTRASTKAAQRPRQGMRESCLPVVGEEDHLCLKAWAAKGPSAQSRPGLVTIFALPVDIQNQWCLRNA